MERSYCPKCGNLLPEDAPAGLCPRCLLQAGFKSEIHPETAATGPDQGVPPRAKSPGFESPSLEKLGPLFPQLEILEFLGKGGMGAVYKARQRGLERMVAVKILPPEFGNDPSFAERFTREARALAKLNHPNIVAVHDFGQTNGLFYIMMEFVDGVNLRQTIMTGSLKPRDAIAIIPQICEALQFAHDEGIVHRDIKPENILLDKKGRVKIADFGLSKMLGNEPPDQLLTGTHQVMGTPRYMAPEQMNGSRDVDHRADIYSLGVVFYELLTGELPMGKFALPSKKVLVDVRLDEVVLRALEQEPQKRYQHASEVKLDVEGIASGSRSGQRPIDLPRETGKPLHSAPKALLPPPRFSRKAILGAIWAPMLFLLFVSFFFVRTVPNEQTARAIETGWDPTGLSNSQRGEERPANKTSPRTTSLETVPIWSWFLLCTLVTLGLSAPFGTTILGCIAISDIQISKGRLRGMPLALADALFFPLLALDGLIYLFWYLVFSSLSEVRPDRVYMITGAVTILSVVVVDLLIMVWAWKRIQKPELA